ncbi:AraC family transcriptional regulator [Noviherbaspirillum sp.]|uniref:AraC family transcriptional regulator n=1 Tax=Noviherbaspirillum sp. TaxID=1926288 RepID=UPI002D58A33A|nr:AraC family transcriptional regulator [Noviherbaspirillum sp.]HZW20883.1 AraC family transcriptional regulator [Noviherbaspirillum sp.]
MPISGQWLNPAFHPSYVRVLCVLLRKRGIDTPSLLAGTGLQWEQLVDSGTGIGLGQIRPLVHAALRLSGTPALGLELGAAIPVSAHGPVGHAVVASRDVRQALDVIVRYGRLRGGALEFRLAASGTHCHLQVRERIELGEVRVPVLETVLIVLAKLLESLTGYALEDMECALPYPAPPWAGAYATRFSGRLHFGAPCMELRLPHAMLDVPCLTADPSAHASAIRECDKILAQLLGEGDVVEQVRARLQGCGDRLPGCEAMAAELHISARTLMRRLKQHGTSYQALLDDVRKEQAQWYLRHTARSVESIAEALGYLDTSNFSRSFRRWFGMPPSAFRQQDEKR